MLSPGVFGPRLIFGVGHPPHVLKEYVHHFEPVRPHQGSVSRSLFHWLASSGSTRSWFNASDPHPRRFASSVSTGCLTRLLCSDVKSSLHS
jgi:hypothetical protein